MSTLPCSFRVLHARNPRKSGGFCLSEPLMCRIFVEGLATEGIRPEPGKFYRMATSIVLGVGVVERAARRSGFGLDNNTA